MRDFKKYLKDGKRVAAFGKQIGQEVELFLLYCSKKDQFSKKKVINAHLNWITYGRPEKLLFECKRNKVIINKKTYIQFTPVYAHPVIIRIPIQEGDSAEYTFKKYMRDNFYRLQTRYYRMILSLDYLVNDFEQVPLEKTARYRRLCPHQ